MCDSVICNSVVCAGGICNSVVCAGGICDSVVCAGGICDSVVCAGGMCDSVVLVGYVMLCVKYSGRLYESCCVMVRGVMVCDGEYNIGKVISL